MSRPHEIGAVLQGLRRSLGLTQAAVAARAGVTRKWISQMENGKASAEIGVLCRVLNALDCHLEIVYAPSERTPLEEHLASFVSEYPS